MTVFFDTTVGRLSGVAVLACLLSGCGNPLEEESRITYDLVITGGQILDGTGQDAYSADIAVKNGKIAMIGDFSDIDAAQYIDATGKIVAPGFIDIHSHADDIRGRKTGLRADDINRRQAKNIVTQGITTVLVNPDGFGDIGLPIKVQSETLRNLGTGPNVALMVPHNAIRMEVLGGDYKRKATDSEILAMQHKAEEGMQAGAFGLSSGLEYIPSLWSNQDELLALMKTVGSYNGVHISHMRSETSAPMWWIPSQDQKEPPELMDAVSEIIDIAEQTQSRGVITHLKVRGTTHWGQSENVIQLIEAARQRGVQIYADQYPYSTSGSDGRIVLLPRWALNIDPYAVLLPQGSDYSATLGNVLADETLKENLYSDIRHAITFRGGAENIVIYDYPDATLIGRNLKEIADEQDTTIEDLVIMLQMQGYADRPGGVRMRSFSLQQDDMVRIMQKSWVATASDGGVALPEDGPAVHARYYGTFPRKIGYYSRELGAISLESVVRSATGLPAEILQLKTRGFLKPGMVADITVFDYDEIIDMSTFENPHQYAKGVEHVLINGISVVMDGQPTGALAGKVLTFKKD